MIPGIPYHLPVKPHIYNRRWVLRDPINKEVFEIMMNSNSLDYWKRMTALTQFIADLMNGRKSIAYDNDSKSYAVMEHLNAPEAAKMVMIPGLTQPQILPGIQESKNHSPLPSLDIPPLDIPPAYDQGATNGQETDKMVKEMIFERVGPNEEDSKPIGHLKRRGRPPGRKNRR